MATTLLMLLLIAISPFSISADVTWSIDCGSSEPYYIDDNINSWVGDDTIISAGQSRTAGTSNSLHVMSTLRVFTSGKKNCYVLAGQKGAKLLVRASFFYANYDGKSSPPSFDLQIDGNDWATVVTDMDTENYVYYELTYTSKGDSISVCLLQTNSNQYPFISALEVRTLDSKMYQYFDAGQALSLAARYSFGADKSVTDQYDRIWAPATLTGTEYTSVAGTAIYIDTTTVIENPPADALANAMTTANDSARSMKWQLTGLDSTPSLIYLNLYFSEVIELDPTTDKRSFSIYLGDKLMDSTKGGISPSYGNVMELYIANAMASNSTTITLLSTNDSTLPPIINALELFQMVNYTVYSAEKSSPGSSPSGGGSTPSSTSTGGADTSTSSSRKKKSSLPVIFGAGIPGFLLLVAFVFVMVMMQKKRQRAAIVSAATAGGANGQGAANNNNGQIMMGAKFGQEITNEFQVNVGDQTPNNLPYGSPAPLLHQTN